MIHVKTSKAENGWVADVHVIEGVESTHHNVKISNNGVDRLTANLNSDVGIDWLVREALAVIVDNEGKEQLPNELELDSYLSGKPELEREFKKRLSQFASRFSESR